MNELDELLEIVPITATDPVADTARGERGLRRRRRTQVSAAVLSVVAVVAVGFTVRDTSGSPHAAGFAGGPGVGQTARDHTQHAAGRHHRAQHSKAQHRLRRLQHQLDSPSSQDAVQSYHDVLADHLDPHGDLLAAPSNMQSGGPILGSKFDWNHGGMLEIVVGQSWDAADTFYQLDTAGLTSTTYDGQPARVSSTGNDLVVSVRHADGTVVTLIASNGFGNNGTATASLDLTTPQLLAAAADARLTLPASLAR